MYTTTTTTKTLYMIFVFLYQIWFNRWSGLSFVFLYSSAKLTRNRWVNIIYHTTLEEFDNIKVVWIDNTHTGWKRYIWFMLREARLLLQSNTLNLGTNGTLYWWQIWWTVKCKMLTFLAALIDFFLWFHLLQRLAARQERGTGPTLNIKKQ